MRACVRVRGWSACRGGGKKCEPGLRAPARRQASTFAARVVSARAPRRTRTRTRAAQRLAFVRGAMDSRPIDSNPRKQGFDGPATEPWPGSGLE